MSCHAYSFLEEEGKLLLEELSYIYKRVQAL